MKLLPCIIKPMSEIEMIRLLVYQLWRHGGLGGFVTHLGLTTFNSSNQQTNK